MPRVRLLAVMNVAGQTREIGEECDVDADVASYLTEQGRVELVRGEQSTHPAPPAARRRERADRSRGEVR